MLNLLYPILYFIYFLVFEMQARLDFGIYLYESGQTESALQTLAKAFEYSITKQPWMGDKTKQAHAIKTLTKIKTLLTKWVQESRAQKKEEQFI